VTRRTIDVLALAVADAAVGAGILALALSHGTHRDVIAHFAVYVTIVLFFKARDAARRVPMLVAQARSATGAPVALGPWWLRSARLVIGYDSWSRTERLGIVIISVIVCTLFGWDDGGPFAAALFLAVATVNVSLVLIASLARATR
jgi:hypothetical protein